MNKLEERFEEIYFDHVMGESREDQFKSVAIYTKEAKEIAIEFAKKLFDRRITIATSPNDFKCYKPEEFQLMLGELMNNGDGMFNEFTEEKYAE